MHISDKGLHLILRFEGFSATWYVCPAGIRTIGVGHTGPLPDGFTAPLTRDEGLRLLQHDLRTYEQAVRDNVRVQLSQGEFDALTSFCYNVGPGAFRNSTLLRRLNAGDRDGAASELLRWTRGGGRVLRGLVLRREAERALFLSDDHTSWLERARQLPLTRLVPQPPDAL